LNPEAVILASGSLPDMPIIKGLFTTQMDLCTVTEVLAGKITGDRVIVLGGGQAGLVTADFWRRRAGRWRFSTANVILPRRCPATTGSICENGSNAKASICSSR
jgi:hypothetical protein